MKTVTLNCWENFRCVAEGCRHSCCVGWEIDVDEESLRRYAAVEGEFGQRLRRSIAVGDEGAFFVLQGEEERCPFLNGRGLCDMILTLGEDSLCRICAEHPRYRHRFTHREEVGFGLCCEEAARELLTFPGRLEIVVLCEDAEPTAPPTDWERRLLALRETLLETAQDRRLSVYARSEALLRRCGALLPAKSGREWRQVLEQMERLSGDWDAVLARLDAAPAGEQSSLAHLSLPLEQLLVGFLYRHLSAAESPGELRGSVAFSVLSLRVLYALAAAGEGSVEELCELARLYSGEIEYSDENLPALLALCAPGEIGGYGHIKGK